MKKETKIAMSIENKGKPQDNVVYSQVTIRDAIMYIGRFLLSVYMGNKIVITIGRKDSDLMTKEKNDDLFDELESLIDEQHPEGLE